MIEFYFYESISHLELFKWMKRWFFFWWGGIKQENKYMFISLKNVIEKWFFIALISKINNDVQIQKHYIAI